MRRALTALVVAALPACWVGEPSRVITAPIPMHVSKDALDCAADDVVSVQMTRAPLFDKYKTHIARVSVLGARVKVSAIDPENTSTRGTGTVWYVADDGERTKLFDYDVAAKKGNVVEVEIDPEAADLFARGAFSEPWTLTLATSGAGDGDICRFSLIVEFDFELTMRVSALVA